MYTLMHIQLPTYHMRVKQILLRLAVTTTCMACGIFSVMRLSVYAHIHVHVIMVCGVFYDLSLDRYNVPRELYYGHAARE